MQLTHVPAHYGLELSNAFFALERNGALPGGAAIGGLKWQELWRTVLWGWPCCF